MDSKRPESRNESLIRLGRLLLWLVVVTASVKPVDIFSIGEQGWGPAPPIDLVMRMLVLAASTAACAIALAVGRIQRVSLLFLPFLAWTLCVVVALQSDLESAKQIGSYATWILFYIAAHALLRERSDFRTLTFCVVASVAVSAAGGELQHLLGYGPQLGRQWAENASMETEFHRTHTGSGGILLDAFTPYCAALLLMSISGKSRLRQASAWLLVLWGTANILRGGMLALGLGLCWYLWIAPKETKKRVYPFGVCGLLVAAVLFGSTISAKMTGPDDQLRTSGRFDEWPQLVGWIEAQPILGHGPDADMQMIATSSGADLRASHNELLSTGVNFGVVGIALLWFPLLFLLFAGMGRALRAAAAERNEAGAASAVVLMIVVLSFTDNTLRTPGVMILALAPIAVSRFGQPNPLELPLPGSALRADPC